MKKLFFIAFVSSLLFSCEEKSKENKQPQQKETQTKKRDTVGIDISSAQEKINWEAVKADPNYFVSFAICRSTMGDDRKDKKFLEHFNAAKASGIKTGSYHFFDLKESGKKQANNYLKSFSKNTSDFLPIVDIEVFKYVKHVKFLKKTILVEKKNKKGIVLKNKKGKKLFVKKVIKEKVEYITPSPDCIKKAVKELSVFVNIVEKETGIRPMIYSSASFFSQYLQDFKAYPKWVSALNKKTENIDGDIHQFTFSLAINGIKGKVDGDRFVPKK